MDIPVVDYVWNVMAHTQKPDFVFRRNGRVHLNRRGRQFSRLLAAEVCASAVVMLDTPCSEIVWTVLATHPICQFPLHFPTRASPCVITFQLHSTNHAMSRVVRRLNSRQNVIWWRPGRRTGQAPSNPNTAFVNNDVISKDPNSHVPPSVFSAYYTEANATDKAYFAAMFVCSSFLQKQINYTWQGPVTGVADPFTYLVRANTGTLIQHKGSQPQEVRVVDNDIR